MPSDRPKACHPERMRGIQERFLPLVEMTKLFLCEISELGAINFLNSFCLIILWLVSNRPRLNQGFPLCSHNPLEHRSLLFSLCSE